MSNATLHIDKVDALVMVLLDALANHPETIDASAEEIVSATMTVTLRMAKGAIVRGADPAGIRRGLDCIYLACAGGTVH